MKSKITRLLLTFIPLGKLASVDASLSYALFWGTALASCAMTRHKATLTAHKFQEAGHQHQNFQISQRSYFKQGPSEGWLGGSSCSLIPPIFLWREGGIRFRDKIYFDEYLKEYKQDVVFRGGHCLLLPSA